MSEEQDKIFVRNFSLILVGISIVMVLFFLIAQFSGTDDAANAKLRADKVAKMTAPIGQVAMTATSSTDSATTATTSTDNQTTATTSATAAAHPGADIYSGLCTNCHSMPAMATMIPQTGDASVWNARLEQGIEVLYEHAINGFVGELGMMPVRGGNLDLTDQQVKDAVDYMVSQVATTTTTADSENNSEQVADNNSDDSGKKTYEGLCVNCHGIAALAAMIPQAGDTAAWAPRIDKGVAVLYENAINGYVGELGMMPAKGGNASLSDEEVKAAVDYMLKQVQ